MRRGPTRARFIVDVELRFAVRAANEETGDPGRWASKEFEGEALYAIEQELEAILVRDCIVHDNFERAIMQELGVESSDKFSDIGYCKFKITRADPLPAVKEIKQ